LTEEKQTPEPHRLPVGREIRRWRQSRGLTLAQVGEASGLNIGYLSQIENEKAVPSLEALAEALDPEIRALFQMTQITIAKDKLVLDPRFSAA